jgi:3-oxoacyl-[acyl-carrier-protein] synthase II
MSNRVVVTGVGVVTSVGIGKDDFWKAITAGTSGISEVSLFDTSKFKRHYAGEIKNFNLADFIPKEKAKFLARASQFAIAAAKLALKDAKFHRPSIRQKKTAVIMGTTMTEANALDISSKMLFDEKFDTIATKLLLNTFSASIPRNIGEFLKTKGINFLIPNACAAGNFSIGYGYDLIKKREVDLAIVGGAEALSRVAFQGFQRLYAMAPQQCSPFDKDRKGMILGEGAGILILESLKEALKRKASILAEVLGYGISCDAYHMTAPNRKGIKKAMLKAIKNSNIDAKNIDYINAHGTGTAQNDKEEAGAIKEIFGLSVPISSTKSMLGHCMGAASAIEAIACCLAIRDGIMPPTINFKTPDPECDIDCVPNKAKKSNVRVALNNGFAFGGNNCCVVFGKA